MATMGIVLLVLILLTLLVCRIWLLVLAFRENALWGLAVFFLPFGDVVFAILHWDDAKKPFLTSVVCIPLLFGVSAIRVKAASTSGSAELPEIAPLSAPMRETDAATDMMGDTMSAQSSAPVAPPEPAAPRPTRRPRPAPVAKAVETPPAEPVKQELVFRAADQPAAPAPLTLALAAPAPPTRAPTLAPPSPSEPAVAPLETKSSTAAAGPPVRVEFVGLCDDSGEVMRSVRLQVANDASVPVQRLTMTLAYVDQSGHKLKEWTTSHEGTRPLADKQTTNEFKCPAFFMPDGAKTVGVTLRAVKFADGSEWKSGR